MPESIKRPSKAQVDYARDRKISDVFSLKIRKNTGIVDALNLVCEQKQLSRNAYIIEAIREKLVRDGYTPKEESTQQEV